MLQKNHWIKLSIILLVALCTKLALAESGRKSLPSAGTVGRSSAGVSSSSYRGNSRGNTYLGVGPGLAVLYGSVGLAIDAQAKFRINPSTPLYIGGTTGMMLFSYGSNVVTFGSILSRFNNNFSTSSTAVLIPLLGSVTYVFNENQSIQPLVGGALGPVISASGFGSSVVFAFYGRGGAGFKLSPTITLDAEARMGFLAGAGSSFFFQPGATFNFKL